MLSILLVFLLCGCIVADYNYKDCGTRFALNRYEPVISFGGKTLRSEFPWHVALYRQYNTNDSAEYICGGSIIHPKVILTAAHCVYNETNSKVDNATFTAIAGKYYVSWEHKDRDEQRFKVVKIKIPEIYVGFTNRYAEDIALLELNTTIKYSSAILPVCIDWSSEYLVEKLPTVGTVVGWGRTEKDVVSDELLMANLKYIAFAECRDKITNGFSFFITSDKFCAGLDNGTAVEHGDSGGGITFPRNSTSNKEQHYLYGIVSIKDTSRSNIAAFTNVRKHLNWLNITLLSIIDPGLFEAGCPPFPPNSLTLARCDLNGTSVDCNKGAKLGTKAKIHCKSSYHSASPFKLYSETECSPGFKWLPLPESCIECGKRYRFSKIVPLVKVKPRTVSEYPWHVAIYRKGSFIKWYLACGGTIIHPKAVITAAHCVYDETRKMPENQSEYFVAAGKFKSSWDEQELAEQRFQVMKIYVKETYQGRKQYYHNDIAILKLKATIKLSDYIMPVCMDWGGKLNLHRNPLIMGTIPGYGLTERDEISDELRASKLPYTESVHCIEQTPSIKEFMGEDKFCSISNDGIIPARGDGGGSLTFPYYNEETGEELNYLYGIFSSGDEDSDTLLFTNVTYHLEWIKTVLFSIINNL